MLVGTNTYSLWLCSCSREGRRAEAQDHMLDSKSCKVTLSKLFHFHSAFHGRSENYATLVRSQDRIVYTKLTFLIHSAKVERVSTTFLDVEKRRGLYNETVNE